jgi:hypothetical protein
MVTMVLLYLLLVAPLALGVQVFSDVDDTLSCPSKQMRVFGAGVDTAWSRNLLTGSVIYPGIACLTVSFEKGLNDSAQIRGLNLLSARPQEAVDMGLLEIKDDSPIGLEVQRCGGRLDGRYYGQMGDVASSGLDKRSRYLAFSKSKVADLVGAVRVGESVVFMGDNGQGDLNAAVEMYKILGATQERRTTLSAAFIHRVDANPALRVDDFAGAPIFFFNTAQGAALIAYCARLISRNGLQTVYTSAAQSAQHASCMQKCSPLCIPLTDICADSDCQADPKTGFPPGCTFHSEDMRAVDALISRLEQQLDVTQDCVSVLERSSVQFPPAWVLIMSSAARFQGSGWSLRSSVGLLCALIVTWLPMRSGS